MKKIRWGIIGAGTISTAFATALNSLEDAEIVAVAARDLNRAKDFAERFHIRNAYGSYEDLAKDPEVDVVYIGTPHSEHLAHSSLCILHGKSVLCEKPFTINAKQSEELITLAREKKVFLMEAMWTKFLPATRKVKEWIKEGRIGAIKHLKIDFGYHSNFDPDSRLYNPYLAGGALLDVGIYPITYVVHMLEKLPDYIVSSAVFGKSDIDEQNVMIFKYNEGVLADLSSSITVDTGKFAEIYGEKGKIIVPKFWMAEEAYLYGEDNTVIESFKEPFKVNGYEYEAIEVNRCLQEGKVESDMVPLKDTLEIMNILDSIRGEWGFLYPQEKMQ